MLEFNAAEFRQVVLFSVLSKGFTATTKVSRPLGSLRLTQRLNLDSQSPHLARFAANYLTKVISLPNPGS